MLARKKLSLIALALWAGFCPQLPAEEARELLARAYLLSGELAVAIHATMDIGSAGAKKTRELEIYLSTGKTGESQALAQIVAPAFLSAMKFLRHRDESGREERWLKTSQGVRRLAAADGSESLFGSDFTVEDLSEIDLAGCEVGFAPASAGAEPGAAAIEVRLPARGNRFPWRIYFVERETHILRRVDFYETEGRIGKQYRLLESQKVADRTFPRLCSMRDMSRQSETLLHLDKVEVKESLPARLFNRASL